MKKILSSLMLLILVVLFGATYVCSSKTEEVFKAQIEQLNQSYAGLLQVELLDYRRGLLVSEVKTRIRLKKDSLPLQHQIRHFPWKVRVLTGVAADSSIATELAELLPLEQLQLQTDVTLDGSSQSYFALEKLNFADQQAQLQLQGVRFDCDLAAQVGGGQVLFRLDRLQIVEPGEAELTVTDVRMNSQFSEVQSLFLGGGELQIGKLSLQPENRPGFELNELRYTASSTLENDQLVSGLNLQLSSLELGGETFTDGHLQLRISGIDAAAVREMQSSARQLQVGLLGQQVDPLVMQLQLLGLYSQLINAGLTVSLEQLSLQADDGTLLGKGRAELPQSTHAAGNSLFLEQLNGRFQLDIDRPLFNAGFRMVDNLQRNGQSGSPAVLNEQAEQLAGGLIQKGIFTRREEGGYRLKLSIAKGQAELNGHPFRL